MNCAVYSNKKRKKFKLVLSVLSLLAAVTVFFGISDVGSTRSIAATQAKIHIAKILGKRKVSAAHDKVNEMQVEYSIDERLQKTVEDVMKRGKIQYGAFVAMDARTGQVLAMVSHGMKDENLALRSSFPAASIFKVITAAAAVENGRLTHNSMIPVKGGYHTLYKQNVLKAGGIDPETRPRFARLISFEDALAKSVNSVFGKVGIFGVGPEGLRKVANNFQFGRDIPFEMPVDPSQAMIPNDEFGIAESASGFTRLNTLSPVHGALIAASIVNDGVMMEPSIVNRIVTKDGKAQYSFEPKQLATVVDKATAEQLSRMMNKTITNGTSRRAFRGVSRSLALNGVYIGGKTGTLNGWSPPGRYDWFVGFGERQEQRIAVAALCIHGPRHGVKASQVARGALENVFGSAIAQDNKADDEQEQPAPRRQRGRHGKRSKRGTVRTASHSLQQSGV